MPEHIKRKLEEEIRALEHELAHELPKEIKKAAALGDLSENAEYHMAKQRQEFVNARNVAAVLSTVSDKTQYVTTKPHVGCGGLFFRPRFIPTVR